MAGDLAAVAAELAVPLTVAQRDKLERYLALLSQWNAVYNLTALRDPADMFSHHLADCLAVVPPLCREKPSGRVLDVGSGGGLPGVVLAIENTGWQVTCVDAVGKKAAFVRQVAGSLQLPNLQALHARIESLREPPFDLVVSRAFSSLADFTALTRPLLASGGVWAAMKGKEPADEVAALPADITVFHVEPVVVPGLDADRCLVWMRTC